MQLQNDPIYENKKNSQKKKNPLRNKPNKQLLDRHDENYKCFIKDH